MNLIQAIRYSALRLGITSLVLVALGSANIAFAQLPGTPLPGTPSFTMIFDEKGNATINGQPAQVTTDNGAPLIYILPGPVVPGTVNVFSQEDISPTNPDGFSDRFGFFQQGPTGGVLAIQSLVDDNSPPDLADFTGLQPFVGALSVMETGPEGNNGFQWIATDLSTGLSATYIGISDTPEPSTFVLGGFGLIALFLFAWRRGALKRV
jgi:hypothetical protein